MIVIVIQTVRIVVPYYSIRRHWLDPNIVLVAFTATDTDIATDIANVVNILYLSQHHGHLSWSCLCLCL